MDSYQVHWSTSTNTGCELALLEVTGNPAHRELQTSLAGPADLFLACSFAFAASRHDNVRDVKTAEPRKDASSQMMDDLVCANLTFLYCSSRISPRHCLRVGVEVRSSLSQGPCWKGGSVGTEPFCGAAVSEEGV